jgi:hypothetical protein
VQMIVAGRGAAQDLKNYDQLKDGTLDPSKASGLMVPADSWVLGLVNHLSDGGSLAGERPLASIHPSWLDELFASRIGIQVGAKQTAMKDWVGVEGVYRLDNVQQVDGDVTALRPPASEWKVDPVRKVDPSKVLLVLRVTYKAEATDTDSKFRFSPGAIPLIANGKWILPIGTLETAGGAPKLYAQRPDDFLIASGVDGFDMVYEVDRTDVLDNPDPKATDAKIKPGVFVEIKKLARIDLTDKPVSGPPPASPKFSIMRKVGLEPTKAPAPGQHKSPGGAPQAEQGTAPVTILDVKPQATLFSGINVPNNTGGQVTLKSGSATMTEKKFAKLAINATESLVIMRQGDFVITDLYVPSGKKMLQLSAQAPAGDQPDPWEWADKLGSFTLVDDKGTKYQPNGGWAKVKQQTTDKMVAQYDAANPVTSVPREDGRPLDVWVAFNVPSGVHIVDVQYEGKSVKAVDIQVP